MTSNNRYLLNVIFNKRFRDYTRRMVEDDEKVSAYLRKLNNNATNSPWVAANGFNILLGFEFGKAGQNNTIKAGEGIVVKVFFNNKTGDITTVLAQAMVKNDKS